VIIRNRAIIQAPAVRKSRDDSPSPPVQEKANAPARTASGGGGVNRLTTIRAMKLD